MQHELCNFVLLCFVRLLFFLVGMNNLILLYRYIKADHIYTCRINEKRAKVKKKPKTSKNRVSVNEIRKQTKISLVRPFSQHVLRQQRSAVLNPQPDLSTAVIVLTVQSGFSDRRLASTEPADPPPTTTKSYLSRMSAIRRSVSWWPASSMSGRKISIATRMSII